MISEITVADFSRSSGAKRVFVLAAIIICQERKIEEQIKELASL